MAGRPTAMDAPRSTPMREAELAARWAAGVWRGATLSTLSGATYRLIYEGRRSRDCIISGRTGVTRRTVSAAPAILVGLLRKPLQESTTLLYAQPHKRRKVGCSCEDCK
jgi:hypothetical protein